MRTPVQSWIAMLVACVVTSGCLLNSVHQLTSAPRSKPNAAHAIVVIGVGLDVPWPYAGFQVTLAEYSVQKQRITGNCFHYNRMEALRPPTPAKVTYLAFEVPAGVYAFLENPTPLASPSIGNAFVAPPAGMVYFGDYVLVGDKTVALRQDLHAAQVGAQSLLPRGAILEQAQSTTAPNAHLFLCTP